MFKTFLGKRRAIIATGALLALTATATASSVPGPGPRLIRPSVSQGFRPNVSPQGYDCSTGTSAPFYCLGGENDSAVNGFLYGVYGVEGYAPNATGGVGVLGYSGKSSVSGAYGVYGVTFATNGIGVYGAGDGPTPAPGAPPSSTQQSTGVVGDSHSGEGVYGSTEFPNTSTDAFGGSPVAGVMGVDTTTNGDENNGVVGITTNGGYGVAGFSSDASNGTSDVGALGGVYGSGTLGRGVTGSSTSNDGVYGQSTSSDGVFGFTNGSSASGVAGAATSSTAYGVSGLNESSGIGVYALSSTGDAVYAASSTGDAIYARTGGSTGADIANSAGNGAVVSGTYIGILGRAPSGTETYPLVLTNSAGDDLFFVDGNGDVYYHGSIGTFAKTRHGFTASSFTPRVSSPTVEDVGTGQLVNGSAVVRIDPAVAEQMDQSTVYHVFLTPDGDTRGLFVAEKTPQGFVVRETQGGRGTFSFDYRVVATVDGQAGRRSTLSASGASEPNAQVAAPKVRPAKPALHAAVKAQPASITRRPLFVPRPNLTVEGRTN